MSVSRSNVGVAHRRTRTARLIASAAALAAFTGSVTAAASAEARVPAAVTAPTAAVPDRAAAVTWPLLRSGSRGVEVTALQYLLVSQGHSLPVDGVFGSATQARVKAFQKAQRLTADGVVGAATWARLAVSLRTGARGPAVKAAQTLLTARGRTVTVDGSFTAAVAAEVTAFQQSAGLPADGVVGTRTWAALLNGTAAVPGDRAALAKEILRTGGILLATVHPGGRHAGSTARQNVVDAANGMGALTSPWGDKPGRRVGLDPRMLNGLLKLRTQYGFRISVSEIVGGDHSAHSKHYAGLAFDISHINGRHIGSGAPHRALMAACAKLGAKEVLGPGDAGHRRHVHCGWPR